VPAEKKSFIGVWQEALIMEKFPPVSAVIESRRKKRLLD